MQCHQGSDISEYVSLLDHLKAKFLGVIVSIAVILTHLHLYLHYHYPLLFHVSSLPSSLRKSREDITAKVNDRTEINDYKVSPKLVAKQGKHSSPGTINFSLKIKVFLLISCFMDDFER